MGNTLCVSKKNAGEADDMPIFKKSKKNKSPKKEVQEEAITETKKNNVAASAAAAVPQVAEDPSLKAPKDFTPKIANFQNADVLPENLPQSDFNQLRPSKKLSDEEKQTIKAMDIDTIEVSKRTQTNFVDLIWQLIYSRELTTDSDMIRAIFIWLVSKKLNELDFPNAQPGSPEETLLKIRNREITYAEVFAILCQYANIKCKVINGYAKGVEFVPGMKLEKNTQAMHSWNAACVDGKWHLFDCHWAARRLIGTDPSFDNVFYNVDDFYYMPDPNHLKMTHHPHEERWQLTAAPLSLQEFEKICPVKSSFFKYELQLCSHPHGYVEHQSNGLLVIRVGYPNSLQNQVAFTFSLRREVLGEIYKSEDLSNYGIHHLDSTEPFIHAFEFRFPRNGLYSVHLYVREVGSETFSVFAEYRVEVALPKPEANETAKVPMPFPTTQQNQYGPTEVAKTVGVSLVKQNQCVYDSVNQCVDIVFQTDDPTKEMPVMVAQLRGMDLDETKLSRFVLQRVISEPVEGGQTVLESPSDAGDISKPGHMVKNRLVITPFLPVVGEFSLEVYVEDQDKESNQYHLMWQFLLKNKKNHDFGPLPVLPGNVLGPLPEFFELGLSMLSHPDPFVKVPSIEVAEQKGLKHPDAEIAISIVLPPRNPSTGFPTVRVIGQLTSISDDGQELSLTEYILQQVEGRVLTFHGRFSKPGLYKMHIYAHSLPDVNETLPLVCTYLFYVMPRLSASAAPFQGSLEGPYPKQTNKWKEGAQLVQPLNGLVRRSDLLPGNHLRFHMLVPRAKDVVVVLNGDDVCHLEGQRVENTDCCRWTGDIHIPDNCDPKICVAGRWTNALGNYPTLLEYQLE